MSALWRQIAMGDVVLALALLLLALSAAIRLWRTLRGIAPSGRISRAGGFSAQLGGVLALEQAYELARGRISADRDLAFLHSYRILDFEWQHGIFVEARIEQFFLQFNWVMNIVDGFYAIGHAVGTIGILVWLYLKRREAYTLFRNLFAVTTGLALAVFYLFPVAPPRMFANYGFSDPEQLHHLVSAGGAQLSSYTYNPYAAMPSLHVAYATLVGLALLVMGRGRIWRSVGMLYPMAMVATVIISGNHWILDVLGGLVTVALAWVLTAGAGRIVSDIRSRSRARHEWQPMGGVAAVPVQD